MATHHCPPPFPPSPEHGCGDIAAVGGAEHGAMPPAAASGGVAGIDMGGLVAGAGTTTTGVLGGAAAGGTDGTTSGGAFGAKDNGTPGGGGLATDVGGSGGGRWCMPYSLRFRASSHLLGARGGGGVDLDFVDEAPAHEGVVQVLGGARGSEVLAMAASAAGAGDGDGDGGDVVGGVVSQDMGPEPGLRPKNRGGHHGEVRLSDRYTRSHRCRRWRLLIMEASHGHLVCFLT